MEQVWKDKTCANNKYDPRRNNCKKRAERHENEHRNKETLCCFQYNKFMKGIDSADQYLSFYSVLRKTVKWSKKVVLYLLNCALFNAFFMYRTLNTNKKVKYKNFLLEVGRSWISEVQNQSEFSSDELQLPGKQTTPRGPKQDLPGRLSSDF